MHTSECKQLRYCFPNEIQNSTNSNEILRDFKIKTISKVSLKHKNIKMFL